MKRKNATRSALFTSIISLLLCVSMLVGTTFAWFTDEVASGSNVIASGNLDIAVEYTLDGETWKNLDGANDLFQMDLWEPGHTEVVALRITNKGSLALKYAATMHVLEEIKGVNKDGAEFAGWSPEIPEKMAESDLVFEATWASDSDVVIPDTGSAAGIAAFAAISGAAAAAYVLVNRKKKDEE